MRTKVFLFLIVFIFQLYQLQSQYVQAPYAFWAHSHVIWINKDEQNQTQMYKLVQNYKKYQIPVGGVNIDSGWAQHYSDFIWNKKKFPNPLQMVNNFHYDNIKAILWVTSIVNNDSDLYKQGVEKGYFLNHGKTANWWHGDGAFVDFLNPQATQWYKKQMDKILDLGFDGWKCDGADPLIVLLRPWPYSPHKKRYVGLHQYGHLYYGTFYNHTKQRNPNGLIMARPVDSFQNNAYLAYAPKYVMFSGWVGDQHADFQGLKQATTNVLHSAWKGYLNFGFDIGGYKTSSHSSKIVFIRWAQLGSVVPFMQNGGGGIHQPWRYDSQIIRIYRKFVYLHYDLSSFFFTAGIKNYALKKSVLKPLAKKQAFISFTQPETYGYKIDDTFLVFPIFSQNGIAQMQFPKGTWIYYFDHSKKFQGPIKTERAFPLDEFPLFIKPNSIYPIQRSYLSLPYIDSSNNKLPKDQIVFVYLQQGSMNKMFNHENFTDYLNVTLKQNQLDFGLKRFNKNISLEAAPIQIQIRIIGISKTSIIKVSEIGNNSTKVISSSTENGDIIFSFDISNKIKVENIEFGQIQYQEQEEKNEYQDEEFQESQVNSYLQEQKFDLKTQAFFQQIFHKMKN